MDQINTSIEQENSLDGKVMEVFKIGTAFTVAALAICSVGYTRPTEGIDYRQLYPILNYVGDSLFVFPTLLSGPVGGLVYTLGKLTKNMVVETFGKYLPEITASASIIHMVLYESGNQIVNEVTNRFLDVFVQIFTPEWLPSTGTFFQNTADLRDVLIPAVATLATCYIGRRFLNWYKDNLYKAPGKNIAPGNSTTG